MLDAIGLSKKDAEGFRVRTDNGQRLRIEILVVQAFLPWPRISEMVADQWAKVGIKADVKEVERTLAMTKARNNEHQIMAWENGGSELLFLFPRNAIPVEPNEALMGPEHAKWFVSGGTQGKKPEDPNILKVLELFSAAAGQKSDERIKTAQEIWRILIDQQYSVGTVGQSPALMGVRLVSDRLGNVPARNCIAQHCRTPGGAHPETWFYKN
jgi:peptide/nickel transport system substrate-binding protein